MAMKGHSQCVDTGYSTGRKNNLSGLQEPEGKQKRGLEPPVLEVLKK